MTIRVTSENYEEEILDLSDAEASHRTDQRGGGTYENRENQH